MLGVILRVTRTVLLLGIAAAAAFLAAGYFRTKVERRVEPPRLVPAAAQVAQAAAKVPAADLPGEIEALEAEVERLRRGLFDLDRKLFRHRPKGPFIVIDVAHNKLTLRHGERVLREATCSTGSGRVLADLVGGRSWVFSTPRGEFHVTNRLKNPTWRKPDWAFIEEGEPVPTRRDAVERFEDGVLGEYALAFGDGFLIHGTLYTRLLGKSVTHGCVRLGPIDLKAIYDATDLYSKIYTF